MRPLIGLFVFVLFISVSRSGEPRSPKWGFIQLKTGLTRAEFLSELEKPEALVPDESSGGAKGVLERELHLIPDNLFIPTSERHLVDPGSSQELVSEGVPKDAPLEVDLSTRGTPVKKQDDGKCSAFGLTAAIENTLQKNHIIPNLDLSEWHLWSKYRVYSAPAALKAASAPGNAGRIGDEVDYPQYGVPKKSLFPHTRIAKSTYIGDDSGKMVKAFMEGKVVYLALKTPKQMLSCNKTINLSSGYANGGHAVLLEGYVLDSQRNPFGKIKNSWGTSCGAGGFQYLDMRWCKKSGVYCMMWVIDEVDSLLDPDLGSGTGPLPVPAPLPVPEVKPAPTELKCKRLWYAPWVKKCSNPV